MSEKFCVEGNETMLPVTKKRRALDHQKSGK